MEIDVEAERREALLKRAFIFPPSISLPDSHPNVLIGNFANEYEGNSLILDAYDIRLLLDTGPKLINMEVGDCLRFLGEKYLKRKKDMDAIDTTHYDTTMLAHHNTELDRSHACDRLARKLISRGDDTVRIFINVLDWGSDHVRKGPYSPRKWSRWAASQLLNPSIAVDSIDMLRLIPRGTQPGMVYQLAGLEDLTTDLYSANVMQDYTSYEGMLHMGSVHPLATADHSNISYGNGDDLHSVIVCHFRRDQVWGEDLSKPFPLPCSYDQHYNNPERASTLHKELQCSSPPRPKRVALVEGRTRQGQRNPPW
jgi:hypothetical protein